MLGAYLLAKEAGIFLDAPGVEICQLPIVPLFETIEDLREAPAIMRALSSSRSCAAPPAGRAACRR